MKRYNNDFPFAFISYSNVNPNDFEKIFNYSSFTKYELLIIGPYSINQDYEGCWRYFEDFYKQQVKVNLQQIILEANVANINGTINKLKILRIFSHRLNLSPSLLDGVILKRYIT